MQVTADSVHYTTTASLGVARIENSQNTLGAKIHFLAGPFLFRHQNVLEL